MITLDKWNTLREQFYSLQFGSENSMFTSLLHSAVQMNSSTFSSDTLEQQYFLFKMNNLFNVYLNNLANPILSRVVILILPKGPNSTK